MNLTTNSIMTHGVLLVMFNLGVLLTGESRVGKSSVALELIQRGHHLIADDVPIFHKDSDNQKLIGSCSPILQDFLEIPGLGVVNIRKIYGEQAIIFEHVLDFVIHLDMDEEIEPLSRNLGKWEQLGISVTQLTLPITERLPLASIIEIAVQDYQLCQNGYDSLLELEQRQCI
ncbi:HPr kinase/phosphorylase [Candidatus Nitrosacidococcus tergens]|uniref:HPr kinase n=1 Tax=Candidatus Nitrosacidococcus tergens TaxID=553981 RepID=A0A7G1QBA4_9GAMM|nr:HPr kinase/phosphorylase [Candidatus Nitrosacidococcus tergens]CAB1277266.1 HPr kinase [Candidatus Nitrosacidococcus tergens]